jgi:hypothetical protein
LSGRLLNPFRVDNRKEFVDVLAVGGTRVLFVQAKDSPNTEGSLQRTIERKRQISRAHLSKGLKQITGAVNYAKKHDPLELLIGTAKICLHVLDRKIFGLVIIKEIFLDEGHSYVTACRELRAAGLDCLILDYTNLDAFAHILRSEERFIGGLEAFLNHVLDSNIYPDPQSFLFDLSKSEGIT